MLRMGKSYTRIASILRRVGTDERGIAMISVTLVGVVVAGIVAVLALNTMRNYRETGQERLYSEALVVAESGIEDAVFELTGDRAYATVYLGPPGIPTFTPPVEEREWVLNLIATEGLTPSPTEGGEYVVVKPVDEDVVYAASYVPAMGVPGAVSRVVKVYVDVREDTSPGYLPNVGFLSDGDLRVSGAIDGSPGGAHANGTIIDQGGSVSRCSSAGISNELAGDNPPGCGPAVGVTIPVAPVEPLEFRPLVMYDVCDEGAAGVVREGPALALINYPACTGPVLGSAAGFGWDRGNVNGGARNWDFVGGGPGGVYFFAGANITWQADSGTGDDGVTVIIDSAGGTACSYAGGDYTANGFRHHPHSSAGDLAIVAGRDVNLGGNGDLYGVTLAREHVSLSGTPGANNAVISSAQCDTPSSPARENELSGTADVHFNGSSGIPIYGVNLTGGNVEILRWQEL
jgi:hypothetical protein